MDMGDQHPNKALRERLREAGLRATSARVAVLRTLLVSGGPMSHAEVFESVGDEGFDRATVYRNLMDLSEAALLKRTDVGDHIWRFEAAGDGDSNAIAHPHFVCSDCGVVECLPTGAVSVNQTPGTPSSLENAATEIHLRGICDDCA